MSRLTPLAIKMKRSATAFITFGKVLHINIFQVAGNQHKNYGSTASNDSANGATEKKSLGSEGSAGGKRESFSDSFGASYAAARYEDASKDMRDENPL